MSTIISSNSSRESLKLIEMAYSQSNTNTAVNSTTKLPVLLIHGYMEDASVWNKWIDLLKKDGISDVYPITFKQSDDKCGSAADHAKELSNIIGQVKEETGQNKVNIVAHSKGGLDARVYLANNTTKDVANLLMIGTPNAGSPLAESISICAPAVYDLRPGAAATQVNMNPNTKYYTIAGDWNPQSESYQLFFSFEQSGFSSLPIPNDGMVSVSSVESQDYFINLGHSKSCHSNLMSEYEYGLAKDVILGKK